jgi:hypothetical protein
MASDLMQAPLAESPYTLHTTHVGIQSNAGRAIIVNM